MPPSKIAHQRFYHQQISHQNFTNPAEVVHWLGAVQSQDYMGAKWAVGQRTIGATDALVEEAFTSGTILRTHVMRPTWHFVSPEDIRWMLMLTAPRVHALSAYMYRQNELDEPILARGADIMAKALEGGKQLTRAELGSILNDAGISTSELRLTYLVMYAELEGFICSGARRGKQFTYALLSERAPQAKILERDEALAALVYRYFRGHGPATLKDFVWWSGLTVADAKAGVEMVKSQLEQDDIDGQTYWFSGSVPAPTASAPIAYLLPNYDECLASYKDRSATLSPEYAKMWDRENAIFSHHVVVDGWIIGQWKRTLRKTTVTIDFQPFTPLTNAQNQAVAHAAQRYGEFLGLSVILNQP